MTTCGCGCGGTTKPRRRFLWGHNVRLPASERFWARMDGMNQGPDECWIWPGARGSNDYGLFSVNDRMVMAHRFAYEDIVGTIPSGLVIDHLCRVRACVNPWHLEPVTQKVNVIRAVGTTECPQGHPRTPENTYQYGEQRLCRPCRRAAVREYKRARRAREKQQAK